MVLFPEGGFLHKRKEVSRRYAEKNNLPNLNHVSLPRVGALKAIFSVLPPHEQSANNNSPTIDETDKVKPIAEESISNFSEEQKDNLKDTSSKLEKNGKFRNYTDFI